MISLCWILMLFALSCFYCCYITSDNISDKFKSLKETDFSKFNNVRIVNRKGVYFITYNNLKYKMDNVLCIEKISCPEKYSANNEEFVIVENTDTIKILKDVLKAFRKLEVLLLSVDDKGNVFISLPWHDGCTYNFLKLSPKCTLKNLNRLYYQHYEDNWYLDKVCAER